MNVLSLFSGVGGMDLGLEQADSHRYRQIGNGVAAPVTQWISQRLH